MCASFFFVRNDRCKIPRKKCGHSSPAKKQNMQNYKTTRKTSTCSEKVLFPKKKNQPKLHDLAFSLILRERCSFCSCSAKKRKAALRAASRFFALLAAAARLRCSVHGNCSAPPTLSQILQPCDRALTNFRFGFTEALSNLKCSKTDSVLSSVLLCFSPEGKGDLAAVGVSFLSHRNSQ